MTPRAYKSLTLHSTNRESTECTLIELEFSVREIPWRRTMPTADIDEAKKWCAEAGVEFIDERHHAGCFAFVKDRAR